MQSLIIIFSLLIFAYIRPTFGVDKTEFHDADLINPMTADEIRKVAAIERDTAIERAKSAFKNALAEIDVIKQEAEKERNEKLKLVKEQIHIANLLASTIRKRALREHAKIHQDVQNEYAQIIEGSKQNVKKVDEEYNALVEAAEDQFVKKYTDIKDAAKKIESENHELLEKLRKETETEQKLALERREQAVKDYRQGLWNRNAVSHSAEESDPLVSTYEEELERYEQTMESLEEKWQKTLDDIGLGKENEAALENAVREFEEARKKADTGLMDARKEINQGVLDARKALNEKLAHANVEKSKAEAEAREILESNQNKRNRMLSKAEKKYIKMRMLVEAEMRNAEKEKNRAVSEAKSEYENAWRKAKEVERTEKRTKSGKRNV